MKITKDNHLDHGLKPMHVALIEKLFCERTEFFIETVLIPYGYAPLPCDLHGPATGDEPVPESEVRYVRRGDRAGKSRVVDRPPIEVRTMTVIGGPHEGECILYTGRGARRLAAPHGRGTRAHGAIRPARTGNTHNCQKEKQMDIAITIEDSRVADLLCCGFEGGIGYWACIEEMKRPKLVADLGPDWPEVFPHVHYPLSHEGSVTIKDVETDETGKYHVLDRAAVERGLRVMAEKWPRHFGNFLAENEDATTGDVFIQCCVFGDIVYG